LISKINFLKKLFYSGQPLPGASLVLFLAAIISFLQIPANYLIIRVSHSLGIFLNEIFLIAGLPVLTVITLKFDRSKIFPLFRPKTSAWIISVIFASAAALLIDYAAAGSEYFFPLPEKHKEMLDRLMGFQNTPEFLWKLLLLAVIPGFCEEVFFRGFCQTSLEASWGTKTAIIVTAVLFAILHGNPWYIHLYFLLGFFLGFVYAASRTLWIPITCHVVNNAFTFINHSLKIEYPLKNFGNPLDLALIGSALIIVIIFAAVFSKYFKIPVEKTFI
jgi:membrane protease YdiL (CAAX protease family)